MTAVFVIAAVLLLCALVLTPVRVDAAYEGGLFTLTGRAGPVPVKLFPRRRNAAKQGKKNADRDAGGFFRRLPLPLRLLLAECGCQAFCRLIRMVHVRVLRVRYTAGGPDPYAAAMAYIRAAAAMEGAACLVKNADLRADVDFEGSAPRFTGVLSVAARLWTVLWTAACFGTDFLRGYFRYKREKE